MLQSLKNIYHLGVKEIRGLFRDWLMVGLIVYSFTYAIVVASRAQPDSLNKASIAIVDDDQSQLTKRLADAFIPPMFLPPKFITQSEIDPGMDHGEFTFVVAFPASFQRDVMSGKEPEIQVNVDATRMSQAFTGSGYIQQILQQEISRFMRKEQSPTYAKYVIRNRFNPNLTQLWFTSVMQLVNNITMLAIILTGSALIRERENGTLEHILVMPVTAESYRSGFELLDGAGPEEFIGAVRDAACFCTDSFHGLVFGKIFDVRTELLRRYSDSDPESKNSRVDHFLRLTRKKGTEALRSQGRSWLEEVL